MTCQEFQDHISAAVDRVLPRDLQDAFTEHAGRCPSCRDDFELEGVTKGLVQARVSMQPTPRASMEAIQLQLAKEQGGLAEGLGAWWRKIWGSGYVKPVVGFAVACAAVFFLLGRWSPDAPFQVGSTLDDNVIFQSLTNYHALVSGDIKPQMLSSEPELVRRYFEGKTEFPVLVPAMKKCTLVGGVVNHHDGTPLAHVVYRHDRGIVYVYQACWNTVMKGEKLRLPENAKNELRTTGWFVERHPDGDTLVLWRKGNTLCAAVARMPKEELFACLTSESPGDSNAW